MENKTALISGVVQQKPSTFQFNSSQLEGTIAKSQPPKLLTIDVVCHKLHDQKLFKLPVFEQVKHEAKLVETAQVFAAQPKLLDLRLANIAFNRNQGMDAVMTGRACKPNTTPKLLHLPVLDPDSRKVKPLFKLPSQSLKSDHLPSVEPYVAVSDELNLKSVSKIQVHKPLLVISNEKQQTGAVIQHIGKENRQSLGHQELTSSNLISSVEDVGAMESAFLGANQHKHQKEQRENEDSMYLALYSLLKRRKRGRHGRKLNLLDVIDNIPITSDSSESDSDDKLINQSFKRAYYKNGEVVGHAPEPLLDRQVEGGARKNILFESENKDSARTGKTSKKAASQSSLPSYPSAQKETFMRLGNPLKDEFSWQTLLKAARNVSASTQTEANKSGVSNVLTKEIQTDIQDMITIPRVPTFFADDEIHKHDHDKIFHDEVRRQVMSSVMSKGGNEKIGMLCSDTEHASKDTLDIRNHGHCESPTMKKDISEQGNENSVAEDIDSAPVLRKHGELYLVTQDIKCSVRDSQIKSDVVPMSHPVSVPADILLHLGLSAASTDRPNSVGSQFLNVVDVQNVQISPTVEAGLSWSDRPAKLTKVEVDPPSVNVDFGAAAAAAADAVLTQRPSLGGPLNSSLSKTAIPRTLSFDAPFPRIEAGKRDLPAKFPVMHDSAAGKLDEDVRGFSLQLKALEEVQQRLERELTGSKLLFRHIQLIEESVHPDSVFPATTSKEDISHFDRQAVELILGKAFEVRARARSLSQLSADLGRSDKTAVREQEDEDKTSNSDVDVLVASGSMSNAVQEEEASSLDEGAELEGSHLQEPNSDKLVIGLTSSPNMLSLGDGLKDSSTSQLASEVEFKWNVSPVAASSIKSPADVRSAVVKKLEPAKNVRMQQKRGKLLAWMKRKHAERQEVFLQEAEKKKASEFKPFVAQERSSKVAIDSTLSELQQRKEARRVEHALQRKSAAERLVLEVLSSSQSQKIATESKLTSPKRVVNHRYGGGVSPVRENRASKIRKSALVSSVKRHMARSRNEKRGKSVSKSGQGPRPSTAASKLSAVQSSAVTVRSRAMPFQFSGSLASLWLSNQHDAALREAVSGEELLSNRDDSRQSATRLSKSFVDANEFVTQLTYSRHMEKLERLWRRSQPDHSDESPRDGVSRVESAVQSPTSQSKPRMFYKRLPASPMMSGRRPLPVPRDSSRSWLSESLQASKFAKAATNPLEKKPFVPRTAIHSDHRDQLIDDISTSVDVDNVACGDVEEILQRYGVVDGDLSQRTSETARLLDEAELALLNEDAPSVVKGSGLSQKEESIDWEELDRILYE